MENLAALLEYFKGYLEETPRLYWGWGAVEIRMSLAFMPFVDCEALGLPGRVLRLSSKIFSIDSGLLILSHKREMAVGAVGVAVMPSVAASAAF